MRIETVLIANRGEIARRIVRACKKLQIRSVAVFTAEERESPFVTEADDRLEIKGSTLHETYLNIAKIAALASEAKAQAIHPGYGFLAENPEFVKAVQQAGLIFIGPSAEAMERVGNKSAAKSLALKLGIPCIPGYEGEDQSEESLKAAAIRIGFPLMIKAQAGGGGRGMRRVNDPESFEAAILHAKREAQSAFGNPDVLLEKIIQPARHIEVQLLADQHGNVVHLLERDCSLQRRFQKVVELAPAPFLSSTLRQRLHKAAVQIGVESKLTGAATVEFLVPSDADDKYYFLEVNPRLQVEHPVSEEITNIDIVEWQLRIASGEPIAFSQDDVFKAYGSNQAAQCSLEARIYAEIPEQGFIAAEGLLDNLRLPELNPNLRIEHALVERSYVSSAFDPLLAKLIVNGSSWNEVLALTRAALAESHFGSLITNTGFLYSLLKANPIQSESLHTTWLSSWWDTQPMQENIATLAEEVSLAYLPLESRFRTAQMSSSPSSVKPATLRPLPPGIKLRVSSPNLAQSWEFEVLEASSSANSIAFPLEHFGFDSYARLRGKVGSSGYPLEFELLYPWENKDDSPDNQSREIRSLLPGRIIQVQALPGQRVGKGELLLIIESMKTEHRIFAPRAALLSELLVNVGDAVKRGSLLLTFAEDPI